MCTIRKENKKKKNNKIVNYSIINMFLSNEIINHLQIYSLTLELDHDV